MTLLKNSLVNLKNGFRKREHSLKNEVSVLYQTLRGMYDIHIAMHAGIKELCEKLCDELITADEVSVLLENLSNLNLDNHSITSSNDSKAIPALFSEETIELRNLRLRESVNKTAEDSSHKLLEMQQEIDKLTSALTESQNLVENMSNNLIVVSNHYKSSLTEKNKENESLRSIIDNLELKLNEIANRSEDSCDTRMNRDEAGDDNKQETSSLEILRLNEVIHALQQQLLDVCEPKEIIESLDGSKEINGSRDQNKENAAVNPMKNDNTDVSPTTPVNTVSFTLKESTLPALADPCVDSTKIRLMTSLRDEFMKFDKNMNEFNKVNERIRLNLLQFDQSVITVN